MYSPRPAPAADLQRYLDDEHRAIAQAFNAPLPWLLLEVRNAAPSKPRDGMVVVAEGTNWNPGGGAGVYARIAGSWVKL